MDIGVGAASSEQIAVPDLWITATDVEVIGPVYNIPVQIPKGSRIALRSQCNTINGTDRLLDFVLYGVV